MLSGIYDIAKVFISPKYDLYFEYCMVYKYCMSL